MLVAMVAVNIFGWEALLSRDAPSSLEEELCFRNLSLLTLPKGQNYVFTRKVMLNSRGGNCS